MNIGDRVTLLNRLEKGEKASNLAREYNITPGAISKLKKAKEHIQRQYSIILENRGSTSKIKFTVEDNHLERSLYEWFIEKRNMGDTITGSMLQKKAVELNAKLNGSSTFKASTGFVARFKKRHNIKHLAHQRDKPTVGKKANKFFQKIAKYITEAEIPLDRVYNADKTGLFWRMLPSRIPTIDEGQFSERKIYKDKVTLMMCTNATGSHKLPLLVVGKHDQPDCFNNIHALPVFYKGQKAASMDSELILQWYQDIFLREIEQYHESDSKQCLLLLDNAPCQVSIEQFNSISKQCQVIFLPPNMKSLVQPVNQGIIAKCKQIYKSNLLRLILAENNFEDVQKLLQSFDLLRCCYLISNAWDAITDDYIKTVWKNIVSIDTNLEPQCVQDSQLTFTYGNDKIPNSKEIIAWLHDNDDDEPEGKTLNDQELPSPENNKETDENETEHNRCPIEDEVTEDDIAAKDAVVAINTVIQYTRKVEVTTEESNFLFKLWLRAINELHDT